jgi:hypothetical protein
MSTVDPNLHMSAVKNIEAEDAPQPSVGTLHGLDWLKERPLLIFLICAVMLHFAIAAIGDAPYGIWHWQSIVIGHISSNYAGIHETSSRDCTGRAGPNRL